jgi:hypothetical protein
MRLKIRLNVALNDAVQEVKTFLLKHRVTEIMRNLFLFCLINDAVSTSNNTASNGRKILNWKQIGEKRLCPDSSTNQEFACRD